MRPTRYDKILNTESVLNTPEVKDNVDIDATAVSEDGLPTEETANDLADEIKRSNGITPEDLISSDPNDPYTVVLETSDKLENVDRNITLESLTNFVKFPGVSTLNRLSFLTSGFSYVPFSLSQEDIDGDPTTASLIEKQETSNVIVSTSQELLNMFANDLGTMSKLMLQTIDVIEKRKADNKLNIPEAIKKLLTRDELIVNGKQLSPVLGSFPSLCRIENGKGIDFEDMMVTYINFLSLPLPKLNNDDNNKVKIMMSPSTQNLSEYRNFILDRLRADTINAVFRDKVPMSPLSILDFSSENSIGYIKLDNNGNLAKDRYDINIKETDLYINGSKLANSIDDIIKNTEKAIDTINNRFVETLKIYAIKYEDLSKAYSEISLSNLDSDITKDYVNTLSYLNVYYIDFVKSRIVDILSAQLGLYIMLGVSNDVQYTKHSK